MSAKAKEELLLVRFYILSSKNTDKVYIGSTTQPLCQRLAGHKYDATHNHICTSREIIDAGDYSIDLLGEDECNWEERVKIENSFINGYGSQAVNYNKGLCKDPEHMKQYKHQWYEEHKEEWKLKGKEKIQCECGQSITRKNLPRHKRSKKHLDKLI